MASVCAGQLVGRTAQRLIWNEVEAVEGDAEDGHCLVELADLRVVHTAAVRSMSAFVASVRSVAVQ